MRKFRFLSGLLTAALMLHGTAVYASAANNNTFENINYTATTGSAISSQVISEEKVNKNSLRKAAQTKSIFDNKTYTHSDAFDGLNIYNGIDVSYYNKTIDWNKVKAAGVDYAFIRAGYRGYGAAGTLCTDTKFVENIKNALAAGVKVGVYYFTEAINTDEAIEEAEYCIEKIKDYDVTLPVVIDYEYPTNSDGPIGRMYNAKLSKSAATNNVTAFCNTIKDAGYTPMIYANKSDLSTLINGTKLAKSFKIWLANYTTKTTYSGTYEYWQYSSKGSVNGISGNVDCNFWYTSTDLYGNNDTPATTNTPGTDTTPTPSPGNTTSPTPLPTGAPVELIDISKAVVSEIPVQSYTGSAVKPIPTVQLNDKTLTNKTDFNITYSNNTKTGKASIVITGIGNYTGSINANFIIKPKKVSSLAGKSANKNITLTWNSNNGADGYQIYRKDTYDGSYKKIKTISKGTTSSYKNTKLLEDHEYYYKIRSFATIDNKTYYSSYNTLTCATMKTKQAAIASSKLTLLKTPASDSAKLVNVPKNSTVEYLGKTYLNDNTCYLHIKYVVSSKVYDGYLETNAALKYYSLGKTTANLNMRKAAGTNKKILTVIPTGTSVALIKKVKVKSIIWYKTNYYDGSKIYTGYVSSNYLQ